MSKQSEINSLERLNWSSFESLIENRNAIGNTLQFHYKTINRISFGEIFNLSEKHDIGIWSEMVGFKDILPNNYEEIIDLNITKSKKYNSALTFKDKQIPLDILGQILYDSFGREGEFSSKRYPSAGALYPVIPLLVILDSDEENRNLLNGCYVYDSTKSKLFRICTWNEKDIIKIKKLINYTENHPPHFLAYAIDLRRATTKYAEKGYRHALFEVGFMVQCLREAIQDYNNISERCWSNFIDIALTHICGLNFTLCPIVLIQWLGYRKNKDVKG